MAPSDPQRFRGDRVVAICGLVALSLALASGALVLFGAYEFSAGDLPNDHADFRGSLKNGELWFTVRTDQQFPFTRTPSLTYRVSRLDLQTGIIRDTDFKIVNGFRTTPYWIGETLYVSTIQQIYQGVNQSLVALPPISAIGDCLFEFDGVLTAVCSTADGGFQLAHWTDGAWTFGRRLLLPDVDRRWHHDAERDRWELVPLTSQHPFDLPRSRSAKKLFVEKQGPQYHVTLVDGVLSFAAYRSGFEFVDDDPAEASAVAPENAPREVSGWEPIFPGHKDFRCAEMKCDPEGPLFTSNYPRNRVVRRLPDGSWEELELGEAKERVVQENSVLIASPSESGVRLITWDWWSSAKLFLIDGKTTPSAKLFLPGVKYAYLARWARLLAELLIAWGLHLLVLAAGLRAFERRSPDLPWQSGHQVATLAPLRYRAIALFIDAGMLYVAVWLVWCLWRISFFPAEPLLNVLNAFTFDEILFGLVGLRSHLQRLDASPAKLLLLFAYSPFGWLIYPFAYTIDFLGPLVVTLLVFFGLKISFEARYGITPGKWLTGTRTVSSTLRTCGFKAALVRNLFYAVELPFLLTPLPAVVSLMFSDLRQRLGDRIADTIIIRAGSIREN